MDSTSANRSPEEFLLAFEIGGTTLTAAAADRRCRLLGPLVKARTNTSNDLLEELFGLGDRVLRGTDRPGPPLAIGIASKGPIDHTTRAVLSASLPSLWNLNLPARFTERFGVPAYVDNNANCVALGEVTAGQRFRNEAESEGGSSWESRDLGAWGEGRADSHAVLTRK